MKIIKTADGIIPVEDAKKYVSLDQYNKLSQDKKNTGNYIITDIVNKTSGNTEADIINNINKYIGNTDISSLSDTITGAISQLNNNNNENPEFTGSFSLNRKEQSEIGMYSTTHGKDNIASDLYSYAEGDLTQSLSIASHSEGSNTIAAGYYSHAEGCNTKANAICSHSEGINSIASGDNSHAEGNYTKSIGVNSHAEGTSCESIGYSSHAEGSDTKAIGKYSHAEGTAIINNNNIKNKIEASEKYIIAKILNIQATTMDITIDISKYCFYNETPYVIESINPVITNQQIIFMIGSETLTINPINIDFTDNENNTYTLEITYSNTIDLTIANKANAVLLNNLKLYIAEQSSVGEASHAEGKSSLAINNYSHSEGYRNMAYGENSHTEGTNNISIGNNSHTEGNGAIAYGDNQHVEGKYNKVDYANNYAHIIGGGQSDDIRKNIHTVDWDGNAYYSGDVESTKSDGTKVSLNGLADIVTVMDNSSNLQVSYKTKTNNSSDDIIIGGGSNNGLTYELERPMYLFYIRAKNGSNIYESVLIVTVNNRDPRSVELYSTANKNYNTYYIIGYTSEDYILGGDGITIPAEISFTPTSGTTLNIYCLG